ncbi:MULTISPECIES: cytidylyltransferase domain-containing protein [Gammaproteobacteria]|uniref:acylneuraminate cytidylyltransferase family protein n=1 Tax=Gammaproteobacteria TaxID=1236 RepID=UPI003A8D1377
MPKKIVALLPMKANSERVKGKNFKLLAGKPLFQWILDSLLAAPEIDQVVINTDARHILLESGLKENNRVVIRERRPELCGDFVSMNLILADDIENIDADAYLMTHTTNPLLSTETISTAIRVFSEGNDSHDSLFTVNKFQTRFYREDLTAVNHDPKNLIRTQDLEPWFEENSCLYIFTKDSFKKNQARIGTSPIMYVTPRLESIDIDEPEDWVIASALANYLKKENV